MSLRRSAQLHTLIAILFSGQDAAFDGVRALHALEANGGIEIETVHVIRKDQSGAVTEVREDDDFPPPSGTLAGLAVGTLIGVLGGGAGAAVGAGIGGMLGMLRDLHESKSLTGFLAELADALVPGDYAVLVAGKGDRTTAIDERMKELGGTVLRTKARHFVNIESSS
jgi:uncharacterized membrane protein